MIAIQPPLRADRPAELRGLRRDQSRLLVVDRGSRTLRHLRFRDLGSVLSAGDLLVLNSSRVVPAAIRARREQGEPVQLRAAVRRGDRWDALAVSVDEPHANVPLRPGERLTLDGGITATVCRLREDVPLLWRLRLDGDGTDALLRHGEPIRYSYVTQAVPLAHHQPVYASHPGSAESPSAGRHFTWELLLELRRSGVRWTDVVLHTALSSFQDDAFDAEHHLVEERFEVSEAAAAAVAQAPRVIAVGTTVVRALESAAAARGRVEAGSGWTSLAIGPETALHGAGALLTGLHESQASHLELVRAFIDEPLLERAYAEALDQEYLWHEFGDCMLIL